jgi:hypothetical protein
MKKLIIINIGGQEPTIVKLLHVVEMVQQITTKDLRTNMSKMTNITK